MAVVLLLWASLGDQTIKNLPAMQETWVQSLGLEDPLPKGMATRSSILAWRIPWLEEPSGLTDRQDWETSTCTFSLVLLLLSAKGSHWWHFKRLALAAVFSKGEKDRQGNQVGGCCNCPDKKCLWLRLEY